jgi:uncharacterized protein
VLKTKLSLKDLAAEYGLQLIYAFGSRSVEARQLIEEGIKQLSPGPSDLDIGIKSARRLTISEKVEIALRLEDIFGASRVDLAVLDEASVFLALEIVTGELLFATDLLYEAEYQLYIMRKAAELIPYQRAKEKMMLGISSHDQG